MAPAIPTDDQVSQRNPTLQSSPCLGRPAIRVIAGIRTGPPPPAGRARTARHPFTPMLQATFRDIVDTDRPGSISIENIIGAAPTRGR